MTTPKCLIALALAGWTGLTVAGSAAAKTKLDPESAKFYETGRLIMTREETKIFQRLPDAESRREFIADFWLKRDPDPDTPDNEYREEFEARVAFVNKRFNKEGGPGTNTDRGRVYLFMGPPNQVDEFPPQTGAAIKGFVVRWSYYDDRMAVEFVDETGTGKYRINDYAGDFFGAMDLMKLGRYVRADDVFSKKFVKFDTVYDAASREIEVRIPAKGLMLRENEDGRLQVDLRFRFYLYGDGGRTKESFLDARSFVTTVADEGSQKTVSFRFARVLAPGTNFVDIIIQGKEGAKGKIRQIFEIKVPRKTP